MKKKLLSLVLTGAMVVGTSVNAFADTTLNQADNQTPTTDVTITGKVLDDNGNAPTGTFNVTVPTAAAFTVNQDGNLEGTKINIKNNGQQNIDVYAQKFVDTTKTSGDGITVVPESELKSKNRSYVSLKIYGKVGALYLKTESAGSNNGLYKDNALTQNATSEDDLKLTSIASGQNSDLTLEGRAGELPKSQQEGKIATAISNDFTLTLKIKKSAN